MARLRRILLLLVGVGALAMAADLVLLEHYEDGWQFAPFALLLLTLVAAAWLAARPTQAAIRGFRGAMGLLMAGGVLGLWLHFGANVEFERELAPDSAGIDLVWNAIKGAAPPTMAPASLINLGLLGLAATYGQGRIEGDDR